MTIDIIPRDKWKPREAPRPMDLMKFPMIAVYVTSTQTKICKTEKQCLTALNDIQLFHLKGGMFDIPFNFLIGGDGKIYEGRGWDWGALIPYTKQEIIDMYKHPHQNKSLVIGHVCKRPETNPDHPMAKATLELINYGIEINMIIPDYESITREYWMKY